jgi:glycine/D-amino acid oxidase-like deaminating enzyme
MSWQRAKAVAARWCDEHLDSELKAKLVQLVSFPDDATCRFFYSDRDAGFHRMITTAIAREARQRGAKTIYVPVTLADFEAWRRRSARADSEQARTEFIESCHRVLG